MTNKLFSTFFYALMLIHNLHFGKNFHYILPLPKHYLKMHLSVEVTIKPSHKMAPKYQNSRKICTLRQSKDLYHGMFFK